MTEAEWRGSAEPRRMLNWLHNKASPRKLRLFATACCRQVWPLLCNKPCREAVEVAEQYADARASDETLARARDACVRHIKETRVCTQAQALARATFYATRGPARLAARNAAGMTARILPEFTEREQAGFLRCIFDHLFSWPGGSPSWLARNDGAPRRIAEGIYEVRGFDRLPILADALLDAGCDNDHLLDHCRSPGPHVRGCWALDLILGKE